MNFNIFASLACIRSQMVTAIGTGTILFLNSSRVNIFVFVPRKI